MKTPLVHLSIASLSKQLEDLHNLLSLLKHPFNITGMSVHKTIKK